MKLPKQKTIVNNSVERDDIYWDYIIESKSRFTDVHGKEIWEYRDLLYLLVKRDMISFYSQTLFGPLWFLLQPILQTLIFIVLFGKIAKLSVEGLPHVLFYLLGIVLWTYFSESLTKTSTVFKDNVALMGKVYFPRLIMPFSIVLSGLLKFAIQFTLFLLFYIYYCIVSPLHANAMLFVFPFILLLLLLQSLGVGLIIAAMTGKYRDLAFILSFGIQLLMYITPVVYPLYSAPAKIKLLLWLNPLSALFEWSRYGFLNKGYHSNGHLIYCIACTLLLLLIGILMFNKVEKKFIDSI
jgi:lipopolysaccharide transport system permease protein